MYAIITVELPDDYELSRAWIVDYAPTLKAAADIWAKESESIDSYGWVDAIVHVVDAETGDFPGYNVISGLAYADDEA